MKSHPSRPWRKLQVVAAAISASIALATGQEAPDFFDIIGKSPAEVVASMSTPYPSDEVELMMSGFVGTPMSREHREQLLARLREIFGEGSASYLQKFCLSALLQEDGHFDEALAVTRTLAPGWSSPQIWQTALLWKAGKAGEATELAAGIVDAGSQEGHWLSLVAVDLNRHRPEEAMQLLTFLEGLSSLPPRIRHALAIQHLSIARRTGGSDRLIASTASPVLRAVWHAALDQKAEALACVAEKGAPSSAGDLALLALALPDESAVMDKARDLLRSNDLSTADRLALLQSIHGSEQRVELWIDMQTGHEETAECVDPIRAGVNSPLREQLRDRCLEVLKTHPESTRLKWVAVRLGLQETPEGKAMLQEIARTFRDIPDLRPWGSDPAQGALEILAKQSSPEELHKLLFDAPGFVELPPQARLRYLMAADLDFDVIEVIKTCPFNEPAHDSMSGSIQSYLGRRNTAHEIPDELFALLIERLPALALGSPEKKGYLQGNTAESWLTFLGTRVTDKNRLTDAVHRLLDQAGQRSPETREQVLRGLPVFTWSLPGLKIARPEKKPAPVAPSPPAYRWAFLFSPPDSVKTGQDDPIGGIPSGIDTSVSANPNDGMRFLVHSPWTQNLRGISDRKHFDPVLQAKLRKLFDAEPSRTLIYDLLVEAGKIDCPDAEVKAAAGQRVAALVPSREEDPAIAMFLLFQQLSKGTPLEKCLPLLDGLKSFPQSSRLRLLRFTASDRRLEGSRQVIREKLGFQMPARPTEPPQAPDAYDRLQFFIEGGKQDSPEAIGLAKEVLSAFVNSGKTEPSSTENIAISSLTTAKRFAEFLGELKSRMEAAGKSELEVQRALFRLHLYHIVHNNGEAEPFAKRVFALDPTDKQAAWEVLGAATRENDAALTLKCIDVLARESPPRLAAALLQREGSSGALPSPSPLTLFVGERTRGLVETLMRAPLGPESPYASNRSDSSLVLATLYLHVARHDPEQLKPLLKWGRALDPSSFHQLLSLADDLKKMQLDAAALDLLVESLFVTQAEGSASPLRFRAKATRILPNPNTFPLSTLARSGWAKQLAETEEGKIRPEAPDGTRVLLALAADPRPETWDQLVPTFIETLPVAMQPEIRRQMEALAAQLTEAPALRLHLTQQRGGNPGKPETLHSLSNKLNLAREAGNRAPVTALWTEAKALLEKAPARERLNFLVFATSGFASLSDPAVWKEFIAAAGKTDGFAKEWATRHDYLSMRDTAPDRMADLARLVLPAIQPDERNQQPILRLFTPIATADSPDLELLKQFRPWMEDGNRRNESRIRYPARAQWIDLLSADPAAVCPVIHAHPEADGGWSADWSLAGYRGTRLAHPSARAFPYLSGQFDIQILAGPAPERMARVATIPKAAVTGRVKLNLQADAKFIAALASQTSGDIVRWSHPVALDASLRGEAIELNPVATGKTAGEMSATPVPSGGPFGTGDAIDFRVPAGASVELARVAWEEGDAPMVCGWIQQQPDAGRLSLSFCAADGTEVGTAPLETGDYEIDALPFWRRFKTSTDRKVPADTATIALVFKGEDRARTSGFRLADVRAAPPSPVVLPAGFTTLGRLAGAVSTFAMDQTGNRIAVGSYRSGVGVFDFTTNVFSGWIPLGEDQGPGSISWLASSGDRLLCAETTGEVHLISLSKKSSRMIRKTEDLSGFSSSGHHFVLSPDGRFLAWRGIMAGLRIAELGDDGILSERLLETLQLHALRFDAEKKMLTATGGENLYSLPLEGWQTAELKVERPSTRPSWVESGMTEEAGRRWSDDARQVTLRTGFSDPRYEPQSRTVLLPEGIVAGDRDGVPFSISASGRVMRIDIEKLEGYLPPERK